MLNSSVLLNMFVSHLYTVAKPLYDTKCQTNVVLDPIRIRVKTPKKIQANLYFAIFSM